ncbi:MAG: UvrD-helicase domain-containing protein [Chthoniobacterales bacterium]
MKDLARVLLIVANAGSGKTYRLVTRCLELIARGEAPDRILALTFTRKAAAEFLQKLFGRLADAARDPAELSKLREELGDPDLTADQCTQWLRHLTAALPRLSMGTMDGFFGRIVRAFPFELGLGREFRLLDEAGLEEHRRLALDRLFVAAANAKGGLDQLVELLRQESRHRSDRSVLDTIESAAQSLQQSYLDTPPDIAWGDADRIWPDGKGIIAADSVEDSVRALQSEITATHPDLGTKAKTQWSAWFDLALAHRPPRRMSEGLEKFLSEKLAGHSEDKKAGEAYVPVGGKTEDRLYLRGDLPALRENLRRSLVKLEIEAKLDSSRALHTLLARYESVYDATVRETGALTFSDVALFLAASAQDAWRRDLDYRLDGRHDHWLLDEFQDTSRTQWRILEPLADEIIQDTSGARTFFYVGDTKQAIYGWRGGDARLFWEIQARYNHGKDDVVEKEELEVSHRSSRAIVELVETSLKPPTLENYASDFRLPAETLTEWTQAWVAHRPRADAAEGYARLEIAVPQDEDETMDDALAHRVLAILREVEPLERGLDCAILVRTNGELARYVEVLKKAGIPAAAEGKVNPCLATPAGVALLSLVRFIASPADLIARDHALSSPWRHIIGEDPAAFATTARIRAARDGFAAVIREWIKQAAAAAIITPDELDAFASAAADYDIIRSGAGDWAALVHAIDHRKLEENETPGAVRVMTIHQAKGLGVDVVILPELGGKAMTEFRDDSGISLHRDAQGRVQWGLSLPKKDFCAVDPVLAAAREEIRARQSYESLCVLYVAMTRAKKALYCIAPGGRNVKHPGKWLENTFPGTGDRRELGNAKWFNDFPLIDIQPPTPSKPTPSLSPQVSSLSPAFPLSPSRRNSRRLDSIITNREARELGTEVHQLLAAIEWFDGQPPEIPGDNPAAEMVVHFLTTPEAPKIFTRPAGEFLLWRERTYDVEINGEIHTGTFDRVLITLKDGQPTQAHISDFKTDHSGIDLSKKYHDQLESYRQAAAKLLGLQLDQVTALPVPLQMA